MVVMTETTESLDQPSIVPDARRTVIDRRPSRLNQVAAWVGIIAGVVFIVGSVFFTGYFLGRHSGYGGGWQHHGRIDRMHPPMMDRDDNRGGMMRPGMMPGMMGPDGDEGRGPAQSPAPSASPAPRS